MRIFSTTALAMVFSGALVTSAAAEIELSFYTGYQTAPHSGVSGNDPGGLGAFDFNAGWEGRSFEAPPYYGFRATWWNQNDWGFGVEFNHAKVYADDATLAASGLDTLEFSDGINYLTANAFRRWTNASAWTPYVGVGLGLSIPHVEFEAPGGTRTFGYQITGPVVQLFGGVSYELNDSWAIFGEYNGAYSVNEADLDSGGTLETSLVTNAINVGLSYRF